MIPKSVVRQQICDPLWPSFKTFIALPFCLLVRMDAANSFLNWPLVIRSDLHVVHRILLSPFVHCKLPTIITINPNATPKVIPP